MDSSKFLYYPPDGVLTADFLIRNGACERWARQFRKAWPRGMPMTRHNLLRAATSDFPLLWVPSRLLWPEAYRQFWTKVEPRQKKWVWRDDDLWGAKLNGLISPAQYEDRALRAKRAWQRFVANAFADLIGADPS